MTTQPATPTALIIGSDRQNGKLLCAADPARAPELLAALRRMVEDLKDTDGAAK